MKNFILTGCILLATAQSSLGAKVAAVDLVRVYDEYTLIQEANDAIDKAEASFRRVLETADKELKDLEQKGSQEAILAKQEAIQDIVDEEVENLEDQKEFYNLQINRNIDQVLKSIAKHNSYDLILNKAHAISSTEDITDRVLTDLKTIPIERLNDTTSKEGK